MNFPDDLRYSKDHEWIRVDGDQGTVGLTEYAGNELGDIVFLEVETLEADLEMNSPFGSIEAVKTVSDMLMPIAGTVIEYNENLDDQPELVNNDPYGEGWIIKITISDSSQLNELMTAAEYQAFIEE